MSADNILNAHAFLFRFPTHAKRFRCPLSYRCTLLTKSLTDGYVKRQHVTLPFRERVNLGVMVIKVYSVFPKALGLNPHHQIG